MLNHSQRFREQPVKISVPYYKYFLRKVHYIHTILTLQDRAVRSPLISLTYRLHKPMDYISNFPETGHKILKFYLGKSESRGRKEDISTPVQLAKLIAGKSKQPRSGHLLVLCLCNRVIEGVREVTNR